MSELPVRCTMVSVVVLRAAAARVLLMERAGPYLPGAWSYVAGHLEAGETGWQCARRELAEETGLVPLTLYSADRCEQFYDAADNAIQLVPAFVAMVADAAAVVLNGEHRQFAWLEFDEAIARLPFGGQRELFAHVRREFVERTPSPWLRMPP
ncbi:MAG: NUDIX domain-containing protein [Rhodanobacter sp.]|nr:MAG: NUDIX domain-containing protein [Rhodanobacter sp.]TAM00657.1 MAG: NUDIX domain-containing protein [Rhodanobacter sp.]TAM40632.1 MAG: NUDIX domain-containing protein [Rhodanobacter sp.]TAN25549.1 MAG: NUDIX domain-containing protein [Rhodanobacter sp.]